MEQAQTQPAASSVAASLPADQSTPQPIAVPAKRAASGRLISRLAVDTYSPVNQNGSFEFDRVIKSGYVQKRSQKTKVERGPHLVRECAMSDTQF
jgi:hypothetical protein